jgi:Zn-finger nucleic acid-binding protein
VPLSRSAAELERSPAETYPYPATYPVAMLPYARGLCGTIRKMFMMYCAVCKTVRMTPVVLDPDLHAHTCQHCGSIYIGAGEYWQWLNNRPDHQELLADEPELAPMEYDQAKVCPTCGHLLLHYKIGHHLTVTLDHCGHCNGVWFDKDEWHVIKRNHLHDQVHNMFGSAWQRAVWLEERRHARQAIFTTKFGETDYRELRRIKAWVDQHPQRTSLLAYLNDPDPYKPYHI